MNLHSLLNGLKYVVLQEVISLKKIEIKGITCHSKRVEYGDVFVCMDGQKMDGHDFMEEAHERGAKAFVIEKMGKHGNLLEFPDDVTVVFVRDTREAYAVMAANYFGHPAEALKIIGITGTKGKTTVAVMIHQMLEAAGNKAGLIGTLGIYDGEEWISTRNTTPDAFTIQEYFDKMKRKGCEYAVMEVSSQGMKQKRVEGIVFYIAVFTNLGEDHVGPGEHASLSEYRYYKSRLFHQCNIGIGNLDDIQIGYIFRRTTCKKYGFTCQDSAARQDTFGKSNILKAEQIQFLMEEGVPVTCFRVNDLFFRLQMPGMFNVYNALAALLVMQCLGVDLREMVQVLYEVSVDGRMERIQCDKNIACYIDYAHNGMSLQNVLLTFRMYQPKRILLVFGCGGNRAKSRRYEMGKAAARFADIILLTTDNPRDENPDKIIREIAEGIDGQRQYKIVPDRREAVTEAVNMAKAGDIVIIAGKGHEKYQEIKGIRYYMDDHELLREAMTGRKEKTQE